MWDIVGLFHIYIYIKTILGHPISMTMKQCFIKMHRIHISPSNPALHPRDVVGSTKKGKGSDLSPGSNKHPG